MRCRGTLDASRLTLVRPETAFVGGSEVLKVNTGQVEVAGVRQVEDSSTFTLSTVKQPIVQNHEHSCQVVGLSMVMGKLTHS
jgi:hypothetical protein